MGENQKYIAFSFAMGQKTDLPKNYACLAALSLSSPDSSQTLQKSPISLGYFIEAACEGRVDVRYLGSSEDEAIKSTEGLELITLGTSVFNMTFSRNIPITSPDKHGIRLWTQETF